MLYLLLLGFVAFSRVFSYSLTPITTKLGEKMNSEENESKTVDPLSEDGLDFQGIDMRNPVLSDLDKNLLYEIGVNMKKLTLLKTLEDDKVGLPRKLKMLEDNYLLNDTLGVNILTAGLLNDWDFDII